ncbi:MAG: DUF4974 domain-containing protein [Balneolaceae bacterium]|nr:MAG: DUF4974 domain-containing protein [Balneolaceae bacterium]
MNRRNQVFWQQLAKYFSGELTAPEAEKMERWIREFPEREKLVSELHEIWIKSEQISYPLDADRAWERLTVSIGEHQNTRTVPEVHSHPASAAFNTGHTSLPKHQRAGEWIRWTTLAAATVLIALLTALFVMNYHSQPSGIAEVAESRLIQTMYGERATYILEDGTRLVLFAGSRIEIPAGYNEKNRELYLEGEAYFETAHNPDKPFIVHSASSFTEVLGTRFIVQAWPDPNNRVEVIVTEGRVLFGQRHGTAEPGEKKEVLLSESQKGVIFGDLVPYVEEIENLDEYIGWTEGRLVFNNRELNEIMPRIERWYNISIEIEEDISAIKITADIDSSLPMSDVLDGLALTLGVDLLFHGNRKYSFVKKK